MMCLTTLPTAILLSSLDATERTAEPVSDKLANVANKSWLHKLSDDQLKRKIEKYHRPVNCGKVAVLKVNEVIWSNSQASTRERSQVFPRSTKHNYYKGGSYSCAIYRFAPQGFKVSRFYLP